MTLKNSYIAGFETHRDFIRVRGDDALRFLQGMWTSDLKLAANEAPATTASYLLGLKGRPVSPAQILCLDAKNFLVAAPRGWGDRVREALDRYLVADDVSLTVEERWQSWTLLANESVESLRISPRVSQDASKIFKASYAGADAWILPRACFAPGHVEAWLPLGAEAPHFRPLNLDEQTALRIEAGSPLWGKDFDEQSLILEFPFADEISFHKGCYIGQEVVARGTYRGQVPKVFARFEATRALKEGGFVFRSEDPTKPIGKISTVQGKRALGQIRLRDLENTELLAEAQDGGMAAISRLDLLQSKVAE